MKALKDLKRVQLSKNLWLHEYIDEKLYREYEAKNQLYKLVWRLDSRLIIADQLLRDKFGSITINNWMYDGDRNWSGLRTPESPYYSENSQHSFGRASDKLFKVDASVVIKYIQDNYESIFKALGIGGLEIRATWVHWDLRNSDTLVTFIP